MWKSKYRFNYFNVQSNKGYTKMPSHKEQAKKLLKNIYKK